MSEYQTVCSRAHQRGEDIIGINGEEVLLIGNKNIGRRLWELSRRYNIACMIPIRLWDANLIVDEISRFESLVKKVIICNTMVSDAYINCNDFYLCKLLNSLLKNSYKIRTSYYDNRLFKDIRNTDFLDNKLVVETFFTKELYHKKFFRFLIENIKKLSPTEYLKYKQYKLDVDLPINAGVAISWNPDDIISFFNLPFKYRGTIDFYKVAIELSKDKFSIDRFVKDYKKYLNPKKHKCKNCKKDIVWSSSPYCLECVKNYNKYLMDISLGIINPKKIPKEYLNSLICPDCGRKIEYKGLCHSCERDYNWRFIEEEIEAGNLSWEDFLSDYHIRVNYRRQ